MTTIRRALRALSVAAVGGALVAAPLAAPAATALDTVAYPINTTSTIATGSLPNTVVVSPDGAFAYVTIINDKRIDVIDLATNTVTRSIPLGKNIPGFIDVSPDGSTLIASASQSYSDPFTIQVVDIASGSAREIPMPAGIEGVTYAANGTTAYAVGLEGKLYEVDVPNGTILREAKLPSGNAHTVALTSDEASAYVTVSGYAKDAQLTVIDLASFMVRTSVPLGTAGEASTVELTADDSTAFVSTGNSHGIATVDLATETFVSHVAIGTYLYGLTLSLDTSRVFAVSQSFQQALAYDPATRLRANVARGVGDGVYDLTTNPVTGDILATNRYSNTVTVMYAPTVTTPADATVAIGDEAVFSTTPRGIGKSSLAWQESADGTTWTTIPGATGQDYVVTATEDNNGHVYRAISNDLFWGQPVNSAPAQLTVTPAPSAPVITSGDIPGTGTAGEAYGPFTVTATGYPEPTFSATGLPAGLTIDPATGVISGTPTEDGTFTVVVTASNSEGMDSATYTLTVDAAPVTPTPAPDPTEKPTPAPTEEPTTAPTDAPTTEPTTPAGNGSGSSDELAVTGSDALPLVLGAGTILALGAGLVLAGRRVRQNA